MKTLRVRLKRKTVIDLDTHKKVKVYGYFLCVGEGDYYISGDYVNGDEFSVVRYVFAHRRN